MKQTVFEIKSNVLLAKNTYEMVLLGDTSALSAPGQFVNIQLDGFFLRRPISVCDYTDGVLTLIYKVVGKGTEKMCKMQPGEKLDILVGLGNGFDTAKSGDSPVLLGGGAGVPPMYGLCKALRTLRRSADNKHPHIVGDLRGVHPDERAVYTRGSHNRHTALRQRSQRRYRRPRSDRASAGASAAFRRIRCTGEVRRDKPAVRRNQGQSARA